MVLTCMEEAKQLVDKAYKERRERWGVGHCSALSKAVPAFREGVGSREFVQGGEEGSSSVLLSLGARTSSKHLSHGLVS